MIPYKNKEFQAGIDKGKRLRQEYIQCFKDDTIQEIKSHIEDVIALPKYPYRPIIIGSIVIGVIAGWTVLIWMPGGVMIFPITAIRWSKRHAACKKMRK